MMMFEENRRQTYVNAIKRVKSFSLSHCFTIANSIELIERLEMLREHFVNFTDEHLSMVSTMSEIEFQMEDQFYAKMEKTYRKMVIRFRKRIVRKEAEECAMRVQQCSLLYDDGLPKKPIRATASVIVRRCEDRATQTSDQDHDESLETQI